MNNDKISVLVAVKNEEVYLKRCIQSLIDQNFPSEMFQIVIIDGMSTDRTFQIAKKLQLDYPSRIKIHKNPLGWQAIGRNIGIKSEIDSNLISYIDGHCIADRNWLKNLYTLFKEKNQEYLGGVGSVIVNPDDESDIGKVIGYIFSTLLGAAGSSYRLSHAVSEVTTVPFVLYKKSALEKVNFYNEEMKYGEDYSLNYKLRIAGYKLFVNPLAKVYYYKRKTLPDFFRQMYNYGFTKAIIAKKYSNAITKLHYLPIGIFVCSMSLFVLGFVLPYMWMILLLLVIGYLISIFYYSVHYSFTQKNLNNLNFVPLVFLAEHFGYSFGFLTGLTHTGWKK